MLKLVILIGILNSVFADLETPNGIFKTTCFSDENDGECEHSRIKICHDFYACDLVVEFQQSIKRIGYIDDQILVAEGFNTYLIDDHKMEAKKIKRVIPPLNEYIDNKGNKYYSGEGTTYVSHKESGKEIEIVTTGEYSFNQLALDKDAGILFILTFSSANKETRVGRLFGVVLDPLNIVEDKIQAEMVEGENNITALAVAGGLDHVLLGIKTEKGGKLVRLARQQEDPCVVLRSPQNEILELMKETQKRLLNIFEENLINVNTRYDTNKQNEDIKLLEKQNGQCRSQLQELRLAYDSYSSRVTSYHATVQTANAYLLEQKNDTSANVTTVETKEKEEKEDDNEDEKECLPTADVNYMRETIKQLQDKEKELMDRLRKYETDLNGLITTQVETRFNFERNDDDRSDDQITFQ